MKQNGFSIINILVVILIIAALVVGIYKYYQDLTETNRASELISQIKQMRTAADKHRQLNNSSYNIYKKLKSLDVAPRNWISNDGASRWDIPRHGRFFIGGLGAGGYIAHAPSSVGNTDGWLITVSRIANNLCLKVVQGVQDDFDFVALDNSNRRILKNYNQPFSHSNAALQCNQSGDRVWLGLMTYK